MNSRSLIDELFEHRYSYPDCALQERLSRLIGLDEQKTRLLKILSLLLNPDSLAAWARQYHPEADGLLSVVLSRPPLVLLAGDVGSGKTELAETIGDAVARQEGVDLTLLPLSLLSRGQGRVGEMTQLISSAFDILASEAEKLKSKTKKARGGIILLIDEADALAQSREAAQMHHEDRAGVNALIRGIDRIGNGRLPAAVMMCTNRLRAIDPAVRRRAADILTFARPTDVQRRAILVRLLDRIGFNSKQIDVLVAATGPQPKREYSFTFSDLTQRLIPAIILDAYPSRPVDPARALTLAREMLPTPLFQEQDA